MKLRHFILIAVASFTAKAGEPLALIYTIPLPGVKGRFDHFACDSKGHRLTLAALGNNTGEVFDLAEIKHLRTITGLRKPTGTLLLPDSNCFYFANSLRFLNHPNKEHFCIKASELRSKIFATTSKRPNLEARCREVELRLVRDPKSLSGSSRMSSNPSVHESRFLSAELRAPVARRQLLASQPVG